MQGRRIVCVDLEEIKRLIRCDPPVGQEVAWGCGYDAVVLAGSCHCSLRWLEQAFREEHQRPHEWLLVQRLLAELRDLEHLHDTGRLESIKRFATDHGYKHPWNFSRAFRKVFETTPTAFLRERDRILQRYDRFVF